MKDVFAMFRVIARERKKREIEPTLRVLRDCIAESSKPKAAAPYTRERLAELVNFFEIATNAYEQMEKLPTPADEERLHHLAHEQCFIANSVKTEITISNVENGVKTP